MKEIFSDVVSNLKTGLSMMPNTMFAGDNLTPTHEKFLKNARVKELFMNAAEMLNDFDPSDQESLAKEYVRVLQRKMKDLEIPSAKADDILCQLANTQGIPDTFVDALIQPALS